MEIIDIKELMNGKLTYPSWSTKTRYTIRCEIKSDRVRVYYITTKTIMKKVHERFFPRFIKLTPRFCWAMGFLKGEGLSSINGNSYYRFEVTNKNPSLLNKIIEELDISGILKKENYPKRCFQIFHSSNEKEDVKNYWSKALNFNIDRFNVITCKSSLKKSESGVCHIYISDVLLRRVVDEINTYVMKQK